MRVVTWMVAGAFALAAALFGYDLVRKLTVYRMKVDPWFYPENVLFILLFVLFPLVVAWGLVFRRRWVFAVYSTGAAAIVVSILWSMQPFKGFDFGFFDNILFLLVFFVWPAFMGWVVWRLRKSFQIIS
ncbi:MAG: hypothetical protein IPH75_04475 [bacterium]|nr:hypothetical protein [bacterium]